MEDMLQALEYGKTELLPKAKKDIYSQGQLSARTKPLNKIQEYNKEKDQIEKMLKIQKQLEFELRDDSVKRKLEQYKQIKAEQQMKEIRAAQIEAEKKKAKELKKQQEK